MHAGWPVQLQTSKRLAALNSTVQWDCPISHMISANAVTASFCGNVNAGRPHCLPVYSVCLLRVPALRCSACSQACFI